MKVQTLLHKHQYVNISINRSLLLATIMHKLGVHKGHFDALQAK